MTDNSTPVPLFAAKMLQDIEKIARERGETDVRKVFTEMMTVYSTVITGLPCLPEELQDHLQTALDNHVMATSLLPYEGDAFSERLTEAVRLYLMAEDAAKQGDSMAVVSEFNNPPQIEYCFMPGSLVEIRDEALEARQERAKYKQNLFASAANANAANAPAPEPVPVS